MMKSQLQILIIAILLIGCTKSSIPNYEQTPYTIIIPEGFPQINFEADNPLTEQGVSLGKKLYFDNILSTNGNSCNSCHVQQYAYSIPGNGATGNNIMPHYNLAWKNHFGWTGGETILEKVDLGDLTDGNPFLNNNGELGQNDSILARFKRHPSYTLLFQKAFNINITTITESKRKQYISNALSQFMRTMITTNSKYDKFMRNELQFTTSELSGYGIFFSEKGDCFHCHGTELFTDRLAHNNGINSNFHGLNEGVFSNTNNPEDLGKFYTPSLRNIEFTAPYMHDGRFETLEEVIEHYNSGGIPTATIDPLMKKTGIGLQLSNQDKVDLIAFLKTLTDNEFLGKE